MKRLGLILFQQTFLVDFCFKNVLAKQLVRFDFFLITLFLIITFLNQYYLYAINITNIINNILQLKTMSLHVF